MEILDEEEDLDELQAFCDFQAGAHVEKLGEGALALDQDVEVLLEAYLQEIHNILSKVKLLEQAIEHAEELVEIKLDSKRNRLLTANLVLSLVSTSLSLAMVVTGIFGMNLKSGLEDVDHLFTVTAVSSGIGSILLFAFGYWWHIGLL
jgi:magnesium transporter